MTKVEIKGKAKGLRVELNVWHVKKIQHNNRGRMVQPTKLKMSKHFFTITLPYFQCLDIPA